MLVLITIMILLFAISVIAASVLFVDSIQVKNVENISQKYSELSALEIAAYEVVSLIDDQYINEISTEYLETQAKNYVSTVLGKLVDIEVVNDIEINNIVQVKMQRDNKTEIVKISNIKLEYAELVDKYIVDCSSCLIENLCERR